MAMIFVVKKKIKESGEETLYSAHNSVALAIEKIMHDFPSAQPTKFAWKFETALYKLELEEVYHFPENKK